MGTVQKTVAVPQIEYVDNHVHIPVHKHRHVPMVSTVHRHVEVPIIQTVEKIVDVPVVKQVDVPHVTTVEKIVEVPHTQVIEEIMEVPMVGQTLQGNQHHTEQQLPSIREQAHPEVHETHEHGGSLPAEHGGVVHKEYQQPVMQYQLMQYAAPQTVHTVAAPVTYAAPA